MWWFRPLPIPSWSVSDSRSLRCVFFFPNVCLFSFGVGTFPNICVFFVWCWHLPEHLHVFRLVLAPSRTSACFRFMSALSRTSACFSFDVCISRTSACFSFDVCISRTSACFSFDVCISRTSARFRLVLDSHFLLSSTPCFLFLLCRLTVRTTLVTSLVCRNLCVCSRSSDVCLTQQERHCCNR